MSMSSSEIRKAFLNFFESKGHTIVPSSPIVVKNDPTLLFTNAGMNQFKDYFLGNKKPDFNRAADTQKCLRVSGKHNDLEEVGVDTYHHTMFEMLGNWSFGDYFKKEAIAWAWELLTKVYKIDADRLYATVFEGDQSDDLAKDEEAYQEWLKWLPADRVLTGSKKDNFWEMGETGPCGPCSEIHIDMRSDAERKEVSGAGLVNQDHPQVIEIWNLVFMQFNRKHDGQLVPLPAKHVDTGMGFERLVRVLQGKQSNYDTDVFTGTIKGIEKIVGKSYQNTDTTADIAFRVIADHIRAIAFAIADGQLPSNTGAGYVIRRILRRAVRYYFTANALNYKSPLLYQLLPLIADQFKDVFPELKKQQDFVTKVIKEEEEGFLKTLDAGLKRLDGLLAESKQAKSKTIKGDAAFELYDTYGFPLDLTRLIATENGFQIDEKGFETAMQAQKNRARQATAIDAGDWTILKEGNSEFVGYTEQEVTTQVLRYRKVTAKKKSFYQVVLAQTPFYAEMGGQVGDQGWLSFGDQKISVSDTQKENDLIVHITTKIADDMTAPVVAKINYDRRLDIMYNHTATHLLHAALKEVVGKHVNQKGSLVSPDVLRFDVSHFAKITDEELLSVSELVNQKIRENIAVVTKELPKAEALKTGAMHLFGEKYGDIVRVVTIDPNFSIEFCGGTHVQQTGQIGAFVITSESAVAAGVRRIEALTGKAAQKYFWDLATEHKATSSLLKTADPMKAIEKLMADKSGLEKKIEALENQQRAHLTRQLIEKAEEINGVQFVAAKVKIDDAKELKKIAFDLNTMSDKVVAVLTADIQGKACVSVSVSDILIKENSWDAGKIIREQVAPLINGGGGGQKNLATAGGKNVAGLDQVMQAVRKLIAG